MTATIAAPQSNYAPIMGGVTYPETNRLDFHLVDVIHNKVCVGSFELQSSGNGAVQAVFVINNVEETRLNGEGLSPQTFSIPTNLVLTKIN